MLLVSNMSYLSVKFNIVVLLAIGCERISSLRLVNVDYNYDDPASHIVIAGPISYDRSGWQVVGQQQNHQINRTQPLINHPNAAGIRSLPKTRASKLIEWDDDQDLIDEHRKFATKFNSEQALELLDHDIESLTDRRATKGKPFIGRPKIAGPILASSRHQLNKLIYHGRLSGNNLTRFVDGIPLFVDTHKPVIINRRPASKLTTSQPNIDIYNSKQPSTNSPFELVLNEQSLYSKITASDTTTTTTTLPPMLARLMINDVTNDTISRTNWATPINLQPDSTAPSSGWLPLFVANTKTTRLRRSDKRLRDQQQGNNNWSLIKSQKSIPTANDTIGLASKKSQLDYRWKPLVNDSRAEQVFDLSKVKKPTIDSQVNGLDKSDIRRSKSYGLELHRRASPSKSMEISFDDDNDNEEDIINTSSNDTVKRDAVNEQTVQLDGLNRMDATTLRAAKSVFNISEASSSRPTIETTNDWKPLMLLNASLESATTTTTASPPITTTTGSPSNNNSSETNQRSASDLNYIYSSQPLVQQQQSSGSNSYYSNYVIQPTNQVQPPTIQLPQDQLPATIIDTTSGQTPEMIADRVPDTVAVQAPQQQPNYDYSLPQSVATFQSIPPAPLPNRQPPSASSYGYGYESPSAGHYGQQAPRAQVQRQRTQPANNAPQVIRQEHHYHYYNGNQQQQQQQQPQQQPERQTQFSSPAPQQQPMVIRELQPIMISQPIVQQTSTTTTTTPAPMQIIREIVKEVPMPMPVPMQPIQFQRLVMPQPPQMAPINLTPTREQFPQELNSNLYQTGATTTTQRLIRQLTNSVPQVAIRVPALPQFVRLQLPSSLQPPVPIRTAPIAVTTNNQAPITRQTGSFVIPPMPKKTTTYLTETQAMPSHTTIMQTTQFTPATRTTVYTTDHQLPPTVGSPTQSLVASTNGAYRRRRKR